MPSKDIDALLAKKRLKNTLPRRLVLSILASSQKPFSPADVQASARKAGQHIGLVTIYRILDAFERVQLVHRHLLEDGRFSLCALADTPGHHVLLHCGSCGTVQEVHDHALCRKEEEMAAALGFRPSRHVSELEGICVSCR